MSKFHDLFIKDGRAKTTFIVLIVVCLIVFAAIYFFLFINPKTASKSLPPHAKNRVIVKFKESAEKDLKKEAVITGPDVGIASVTAINQKEEVKKVKKIVPDIIKSELDRIYLVEFKNDKDLNQIVERYADDPNIEYAEPDLEVATQLEPNDPYYSSSGSWGQSYDDLWGIKKINSSAAWDKTVGSNSVVVAVIDTGIDYNHPDLAANVWTNTDEVIGNEIDDDHNGYIDDHYGYDFYGRDPVNHEPFDDHGHGTHCAGTIGGVGNNGMGVVGVNWQVKIMGVKFLNSSGSGYISDAVEAAYYAVNNGAKVLSNSWGGSGRSSTMQTAIDYAYNNNVTFVAAAGNSNSNAYNYTPAGLNHVMTIAATDYQDNKASFSSWGDVVEFAAPGVDILSLKSSGGDCTTVGTNYCRMSGTSMATPHAAGLSALVLSANPSMTPDQVQTAMQNGTDDLGTPGKDIYFGYGRINAANSITPLTHVDGTLIKIDSAPEIYVLEGGKKRHIPSPEVFNSWFGWGDVIIVSSSEMDSYTTGGDLSFRPGTLIKTSGDPKVYLIDGGNKRHIVSPEIFTGLGYQWANVVLISPSEEDKYNRSDDLSSLGLHINGALIRTASAPEIYLLDGGKKRHIPNPEVFISRYEWAEVVLISDGEMSNYAGGDRIGLRPGSLARAANQPQVYVITNTAKRHISSPSTFSLLGYRWERIILTTESELNNYTTGENL